MRRIRTLCFILVGVALFVSCKQQMLPGAAIGKSPLSTVPTPPSSLETGRVYGAQIYGAWASGAPYPVFFYEVPRGTTKVLTQEIIYDATAPLSGVHPRLNKLTQSIIWPGGNASRLQATDFLYDERSGILLMFSATLDGSPIETFYDVFSCTGVGIAYLGDSGGANIFYNCATPIKIDYQVLNTTKEDRPAEVVFKWECERTAYEVWVQMIWGKSDPVNNIDVITQLTATIVKK